MERILHLISHMEEGGAQRQLSYMLSLSKKYDPEVATLIASPPEKVFPAFRQLQVPVHGLSYSRDFYAPEILRNLRNLLREKRYSIVHCWMFEAIIQGIIAASLEATPCLAGPHALLDSFRLGNNKAWEVRMVRKTLAMADLILFPSHTMAIDFSSAGWVDPARVRVVQNGVDCEYFKPVVPGEGLVTVGRYSPEKGFRELAQVMSVLRTEFPSLRCTAVGGGDHPDLEGIAFTGFLEDVRPAMGRGAIYITTSQTEGLSCALLEAQAMGIPAVARRIGSNSEVIEPGVNGFLAGTNDEFVDHCRALLRNDDLRTDMRQKARERMVAGFSIQRQVERIESVYGELL